MRHGDVYKLAGFIIEFQERIKLLVAPIRKKSGKLKHSYLILQIHQLKWRLESRSANGMVEVWLIKDKGTVCRTSRLLSELRLMLRYSYYT